MSTEAAPDLDTIRQEFLAQFTEEAPADEAPAAEVEPQEAAAEAASEPAAESVEAVPEGEKPEPKESEARAYRKLLAREAKLREEQKALEADRAALAEFKKVQARLKADPIGYLKGVGLSQAEIMSALTEAQALDLGDLAPAEVRANLAAKRAERIAAEAEERLKAEHERSSRATQEREAQQFIAQYQAGIEQFTKTSLTEFPELSALAAAGKPVTQALYQTAVEMAQANPTGPAPSYAEVAKQLNGQLRELASVVQAAPTPTASEAPATPPATAAKPVLRNTATQVQPSPSRESSNESYQEYVERIRQQALARHGLVR
jgi:hypothetical protein